MRDDQLIPRDDAELLAAWREGSREAGGQLLERHFRSLYLFFVTKVGHGGEVDDLIQRTFTGAVEGLERYRGEAAVKTWLLAIARNVLRQWAWERKRKRTREEGLGEVSVADLGVGVSTAFRQAREQKLLVAGLQRLPIDAQVILELYYWEGLRAREIAGVFAIPEGTVRGRIRKAKVLLEAELDALTRTGEELASTLQGLETWAADIAAQVLPSPTAR
ncbi:RNA polymerase sigma-70 factor, ECF subfamily protein [Plesiocystis pacifica SIR-1]|uniref:RNA polymerase sigma-70 factor, ECF subfamily protein n=1 Tax=Plesiocystis pacifica SIR-1 TaxID=391625 RepID=A6GD49_9BACT|nr:sigma-70 family RNA polymerase sigma factor [Plesiocystis pacifica]EDM76207.1 RNA polymerase sigma-70 factor, ECF subfamily protein [Plesiocystis pacifica SIR-1]